MDNNQTTLNISFGIAIIVLIFCTAFQHSRIKSLEKSVQDNQDNIEFNQDNIEDLAGLIVNLAKLRVSELKLRRSQETLI